MSEIVVTQSDRGKTVDVRMGDEIVIRVTENLSTGYSWEVESGEGSVITLKQSEYIEATDITMGGGGMRVVRFVALAQGSQEVQLQLRRPWEPPEKAIEQFDLTVRVH